MELFSFLFTVSYLEVFTFLICLSLSSSFWLLQPVILYIALYSTGPLTCSQLKIFYPVLILPLPLVIRKIVSNYIVLRLGTKPSSIVKSDLPINTGNQKAPINTGMWMLPTPLEGFETPINTGEFGEKIIKTWKVKNPINTVKNDTPPYWKGKSPHQYRRVSIPTTNTE